jgi:hypothetical protein
VEPILLKTCTTCTTQIPKMMERIDERLAVANQALGMAFSLESIRDFVAKKSLDFRAAFDSEPVKAKEILACQFTSLS